MPRKNQTKKQETELPPVDDVTVGTDGLTDRQRVFVLEYLTCFNATQAAKRAGYSPNSARQIGSENLSKPAVKAAIEIGLKAIHLSQDEVLARLSDIAGASLDDFLVPWGRGFRFDIAGAKAAGKLHLVKKISKGKNGTSIEILDSLEALTLIGKYYKMFTDKTELTGQDGGPVKVEAVDNALKKIYGKPNDGKPNDGKPTDNNGNS
jgi:phage terminase small subunit